METEQLEPQLREDIRSFVTRMFILPGILGSVLLLGIGYLTSFVVEKLLEAGETTALAGAQVQAMNGLMNPLVEAAREVANAQRDAELALAGIRQSELLSNQVAARASDAGDRIAILVASVDQLQNQVSAAVQAGEQALEAATIAEFEFRATNLLAQSAAGKAEAAAAAIAQNIDQIAEELANSAEFEEFRSNIVAFSNDEVAQIQQVVTQRVEERLSGTTRELSRLEELINRVRVEIDTARSLSSGSVALVISEPGRPIGPNHWRASCPQGTLPVSATCTINAATGQPYNI